MRVSSFSALCAAVFAAAFGYTAVMPLLPQLLLPLMPATASSVDLGWHAGAYASVYMVAAVVCAPAWGRASDRYGAKTIIVIALAGSALAFFASRLADGMPGAYAGRAAQGAFASAVLPVATALLAGVPDTAERARKIAGLGAASLLGFFAAPALSAAVWVGTSDASATALYASGFVALAALLIVAAMLANLPSESNASEGEASRPLPWRFLALNLVAYLGLGAFEVALPLAARGQLALDTAQVSLLFAECSLVMLAAQGALMWAAPHRARFEQVMVVAMAVYAAGVLLLAGAGSMGGATAAVGLIAASAGLVLPLVAYLATLEIGVRPGAALGALTAAGGLGQAIGSASGGALYGYAGPAMFTATAFAVALGTWLASRACAPRWLGGRSRCTRS